MNPFGFLGGLFKGLGRLIVRGLKEAQKRGLDDVLVDHAIGLARQAALKYVDGASRKKWALAQLKADFKAIPSSTLNLAIELAVQNIKAELD